MTATRRTRTFVSLARPLATLALVAALAGCRATQHEPVAHPGNLAHAVFFDLKDAGDAAALVKDCRRRLTRIPGVRLMEAGTRCPEFTGPRNNQAFDVAVWVLFDDRAAHDGYQVHPEHRGLVEEWTPKLVGIQVFDAWLSD